MQSMKYIPRLWIYEYGYSIGISILTYVRKCSTSQDRVLNLLSLCEG
jgi:hypothetical protein